MSIIDTLITDRGPGTFYNASDLNRVGQAIQYLASELLARGYEIRVSPKTNWVESDIPLQPQMEHYLEDLRKIRDVLTQPSTTPSAPTDMEQLTYTEANDIESILFITNRLMDWMDSIYYYAGDLFARGGDLI